MEFENGHWQYHLISPALLPTRYEENYAGFDMESEIEAGTAIEPLFVQYKCSEHMVGKARYHQHFPEDYYRFVIDKHKQHNILTKVSEYSRHTYYVAPIFHTLSEYKDYHDRKIILDNSVFATCRGLPGMDASDRHTIGFNQNKTLFFSEPDQIQSYIGFEEVLSEITNDQSAFQEFEQLQEMLTELVIDISEKFENELFIPDYEENRFRWLQQMQYLFQSLGINLIFLIDSSFLLYTKKAVHYS